LSPFGKVRSVNCIIVNFKKGGKNDVLKHNS